MAARRSQPEPGAMRVERILHGEDTRPNIPTAEYQPLVEPEIAATVPLRYPRNPDLDPQLVWRGKDEQDASALAVDAPPLYIQEKVDPKVLVDDLVRATKREAPGPQQLDMFGDFKDLPDDVRTEFYRHEQGWANRMILGDSLQVMASLAERERLRGQVQCIYFDPPYGIKFNSNFQWNVNARQGSPDSREFITREPEQVKAFRDTWRHGTHSYLSYLRDRLTVSHALLSHSGSVFVQISDEHVHRVRAILDEIFGEANFCGQIPFRKKTMPLGTRLLEQMDDYLLWYAKDIEQVKYRALRRLISVEGDWHYQYVQSERGTVRRLTPAEVDNHSLWNSEHGRLFMLKSLQPSGPMPSGQFTYNHLGILWPTPANGYATSESGVTRLAASDYLGIDGRRLAFKLFAGNSSAITSPWQDTIGPRDKVYVVQTSTEVVQRCILMTTDPGDLVLDPTCGSGTTAYVAEQWGRRWITIDTSRVALALARMRVMGARYPYYLLADSKEGQAKEAQVTRRPTATTPVYGRLRQGFVYERVPHVTLKAIANNTEIDEIHARHEPTVAAALAFLNATLRGHPTPYPVATGGRSAKSVRFDGPADATVTLPSGEVVAAGALLEWEVPRDAPADWPVASHEPLAAFWAARMARQREMDASIAARAEFEYLYDRPYEDRGRVRVAGPFTVESVSPHRVVGIGPDGEALDPTARARAGVGGQSFVDLILEQLAKAGIQQADRGARITLAAITAYPGLHIHATATYVENDRTVRAAIAIGPEFGTVTRADLVTAAREAAEAGFDVLVSCAFAFDAHATDLKSLGRLTVLKARMNGDLHMAGDLAASTGNLFVIFGDPDLELTDAPDGMVQVRVRGIDVYDPRKGEVRSSSADDIACWFIDTNYNDESFCVRHAYFLGANDPYGALRRTLKAEIDEEAWESLRRDVSRPFPRPETGRIAVKVINHLGDEVLKVLRT